MFKGLDSNLYNYVFNDPLQITDPKGEFIGCVIVVLGGALIGYMIYKALTPQNNVKKFLEGLPENMKVPKPECVGCHNLPKDYKPPDIPEYHKKQICPIPHKPAESPYYEAGKVEDPNQEQPEIDEEIYQFGRP